MVAAAAAGVGRTPNCTRTATRRLREHGVSQPLPSTVVGWGTLRSSGACASPTTAAAAAAATPKGTYDLSVALGGGDGGIGDGDANNMMGGLADGGLGGLGGFTKRRRERSGLCSTAAASCRSPPPVELGSWRLDDGRTDSGASGDLTLHVGAGGDATVDEDLLKLANGRGSRPPRTRSARSR